VTVVQALPSVSAIVATRDRPELLKRAVASILNQDYEGQLECIVVFDQSEPHPIALDVPPRLLRTIVNDRTPGLAGARNAGVLSSSGDLVGFCDDDDEWLPAKVRLQVEELLVHPAADVIGSGIYVSRGGRDFPRVPPNGEMTLDDLIRSRRMEVHAGTILARRSAFLETVGLVDEMIPGSYAEDYEWILRAARVAPVVTLRQPLARIYWNRPSWFVGRWQTLASALQYLLGKYPEFSRDRVGLARVYGQIAFALAASHQHAQARRYAWRSFQRDPRQPRLYLSLLVSLRLLHPNVVVRIAALLGKGV
jgi:glycosyltransferase involved in cell wall biosynthesis